MGNSNNKDLLRSPRGFTLIEIIIVLIIVGILAAISLPNLFNNIQKSKAAQALALLDTYKTILDTCLAFNSGISANTPPCTVTGQNLNTSVVTDGTTWTIIIVSLGHIQSTKTGVSSPPSGTYATSDLVYSFEASDGSGNTLSMTRATNGSWACSVGTSNPYTGLC